MASYTGFKTDTGYRFLILVKTLKTEINIKTENKIEKNQYTSYRNQN